MATPFQVYMSVFLNLWIVTPLEVSDDPFTFHRGLLRPLANTFTLQL